MTSEQATAIRETWQSVSANVDTLAATFYGHLFEIDTSAARLFARVDMPAQRAKLAQSLAVLVNAVDDPDRLLPTLGALARRHVRYGIEVHQFDSVGDALLWALADTLGEEFTPQVREAWAQAYALIASVMKRAVDRPVTARS